MNWFADLPDPEKWRKMFSDAYPKRGRVAYRLTLQILLPAIAIAFFLGAVAIIGKSVQEIASWWPTSNQDWRLASAVLDRCIFVDPSSNFDLWRQKWAGQPDSDEVRGLTERLMNLLRSGVVIARGHRVLFTNHGEQNAEKEITNLSAGDWQGLRFFNTDFSWASRPGSLDKIVDLEMAIVKPCQ
jgi:hypothetical protein